MSILSMGNPADLPEFQTRTLAHELAFWTPERIAARVAWDEADGDGPSDLPEYLAGIAKELGKREHRAARKATGRLWGV